MVILPYPPRHLMPKRTRNASLELEILSRLFDLREPLCGKCPTTPRHEEPKAQNISQTSEKIFTSDKGKTDLFELSFTIDTTASVDDSCAYDELDSDADEAAEVDDGVDDYFFELAERYDATALYGRRERKHKFTKQRISLEHCVNARTARQLELFDNDMKRAPCKVVKTRLRLHRVHEPKPEPEPVSRPPMTTTTTATTTTTTTTRVPPVQAHATDAKYEQDLRRAVNASRADRHESGLTLAQLLEISNRDLTPEDYELLLLLDNTVPKKTASLSDLQKLADVVLSADDVAGACSTCTVCMCEFEAGETATRLPCAHCFHPNCIGTWLKEHSQVCPLCNASVSQ